MTTKKTISYTTEFKESSAKLAVDSEQSMSQTAKDLGINANTLYGWVKQYYPNHATDKQSLPKDELTEELKRLRKENARLRQERDILKKATAYFANETL